MKQHGVDLPDPKVDQNGNLTLGAVTVGGGSGFDAQDFQAAQKTCGQPPQGAFGTSSPQQSQDQADAAVKFADCMRANGVPDFPDPNASGGRVVFGGGGIDMNDPKVQAAFEKCQKDAAFGAGQNRSGG
jgi:hypothetical protein